MSAHASNDLRAGARLSGEVGGHLDRPSRWLIRRSTTAPSRGWNRQIARAQTQSWPTATPRPSAPSPEGWRSRTDLDSGGRCEAGVMSGAQASTIARPGKLPPDDDHGGNRFAWLLEHRSTTRARGCHDAVCCAVGHRGARSLGPTPWSCRQGSQRAAELKSVGPRRNAGERANR